MYESTEVEHDVGFCILSNLAAAGLPSLSYVWQIALNIPRPPSHKGGDPRTLADIFFIGDLIPWKGVLCFSKKYTS